MINKIIKECFKACGNNDISEFKLKTRRREVVTYRHLIHYFLYKYGNLSYYGICNITGVENHATVLHSRKVINNLKDSCKDIKLKYTAIDSALSGADEIKAIKKLYSIYCNKGMDEKKYKLALYAKNTYNLDLLIIKRNDL